MCGIAGWYEWRSGQAVPHERLVAMARALAHRGPDGEGIHQDGPIGLAARRLAIIDLVTGDQPYAAEDGRIVVVFNGEIYNFQALRRELKAGGHRFRSGADGEVIVHGYETWGERVVERLDGMFAFALWDTGARRLLLARDRVGKKPLYYLTDGERFLFASEIKAILIAPRVDTTLAPGALREYLEQGYVAAPRTFYRKVRQLPPATWLQVTPRGVDVPVRYWRIRFPPRGEEERLPMREASARVRELVLDAVRRRLMSDVPLGAFLSGGVDSSVVVAAMTQLGGRPVRTFSLGFAGDPSFDETTHARIVARHLGTEHIELVVEPQAADLLPKLIWHLDQPFADASIVPTYLVSALARDHVTVVLTGDGGDEVFAGYERFLAAEITRRIPRPLLALAAPLGRILRAGESYYSVGRRLSRFLEQAEGGVEGKYRRWMAVVPGTIVDGLMGCNGSGEAPESLGGWSEAAPQAPHALHRLLACNFETYLPDDLLVKLDRMTMAASLEARCPFLDTHLVEAVARLAPGLKLRGPILKAVLRQAFRRELPAGTRRRAKHGFGVPVAAWLRGLLRPMVHDALMAPDARIKGLLDGRTVAQIAREHLTATRPWGPTLWALLVLEIWLRENHVPAPSAAGVAG